MEKGRGNNTTRIAILAGLIVALILVLGTVWMRLVSELDSSATANITAKVAK